MKKEARETKFIMSEDYFYCRR